MEDEIGELTALDQEVVESLERHEILASDISKQFERKLTFGERLSDQIAEQWRVIEQLRSKLDRLTERFLTLEAGSLEAPAITRPPHY